MCTFSAAGRNKAPTSRCIRGAVANVPRTRVAASTRSPGSGNPKSDSVAAAWRHKPVSGLHVHGNRESQTLWSAAVGRSGRLRMAVRRQVRSGRERVWRRLRLPIPRPARALRGSEPARERHGRRGGGGRRRVRVHPRWWSSNRLCHGGPVALGWECRQHRADRDRLRSRLSLMAFPCVNHLAYRTAHQSSSAALRPKLSASRSRIGRARILRYAESQSLCRPFRTDARCCTQLRIRGASRTDHALGNDLKTR